MHAPDPVPGTAYTTTGPRAGREVVERLARSYPATAHCKCGEMLAKEDVMGQWEHTGRLPGEPVG